MEFWWHHLNQRLKSTKRCKSMICGVFLLSKIGTFGAKWGLLVKTSAVPAAFCKIIENQGYTKE